MASTDPKAGHVAAFLDAAGIPCAAVGANEVCVAAGDIDRAREAISSRCDWEHDELGVTCDGTHVALLPVESLPH